MTKNRFISMGNGLRHFVASKSLIVAAATLVLGAAATFGVITAQKSNAANSCDKVNVVYCGTHSIDDFKAAYNSNKSGHASSPTVKKDYTDLKKIYAAFGITESSVNSMNSSNTVVGTVYRDGRVVVNGKVVATDAKVAARFEANNSTPIAGTNAYTRYTKDDFKDDSAKAYVRIENGKMVYAILIDCGNPVTGTPPPTPPKPEASYVCDVLRISKQVNRTTYEFEVQGSAKNADITGYKFDFGDGKTGSVASNQQKATTNHEYAKAGTYTVKATLVVKADGKTKESQTADCKVKVGVKSEECKPGVPVGSKECEDNCTVPGKEDLPKDSPKCKEDETPETPTTPETPKEIPQTGATAALAGFAGLSSIGGATAYYMNSRRSLKNFLMRK